MYGTVARMKVKPGKEKEMMEIGRNSPPGMVFGYVYKLDSGNDEYIMVAGFTDKEAYVKNANSPEMHEEYLRYRELLAAEPEWNDGEIVQSMP